jgi:hypothetical protein
LAGVCAVGAGEAAGCAGTVGGLSVAASAAVCDRAGPATTNARLSTTAATPAGASFSSIFNLSKSRRNLAAGKAHGQRLSWGGQWIAAGAGKRATGKLPVRSEIRGSRITAGQCGDFGTSRRLQASPDSR